MGRVRVLLWYLGVTRVRDLLPAFASATPLLAYFHVSRTISSSTLEFSLQSKHRKGQFSTFLL